MPLTLGGGAVEGLEQFLARQRAEELMRAQLEQLAAVSEQRRAQARLLGEQSEFERMRRGFFGDLATDFSGPQSPSVLPMLATPSTRSPQLSPDGMPQFHSEAVVPQNLDQTRPPDAGMRLKMQLAGLNPQGVLGTAQQPFATTLAREGESLRQQFNVETQEGRGPVLSTTEFDPAVGANVQRQQLQAPALSGGQSVVSRAPLGESQKTQLASLSPAISITKRIRPIMDRLIQKGLVGGTLAGLLSGDPQRAGQRLRMSAGASGIDEDLAIFESDIERLTSEIVRMRSGAQVSDREFERIVSQLPSTRKSPERFLIDWQLTVQNLVDMGTALSLGVPFAEIQGAGSGVGTVGGSQTGRGVQIEVLPEG